MPHRYISRICFHRTLQRRKIQSHQYADREKRARHDLCHTGKDHAVFRRGDEVGGQLFPLFLQLFQVFVDVGVQSAAFQFVGLCENRMGRKELLDYIESINKSLNSKQ